MDQADFRVAAIVSADFQENTFVAARQGRMDCVVIDPGFEPERIEKYLDEHGLAPAAILNTHGHIDHIAGNTYLKRRWPDCPLVIGAADAPKLTDSIQNLSRLFGFPLTSPTPDKTVNEGDTYSAGGFDFEVLAIPGHSEGHVVYLWRGMEPYVAFVGDVIFEGGIGRPDFPDGDLEALLRGIRTKLFTLPDDTVLYPGHGPATTVGREKRHNPFVRP